MAPPSNRRPGYSRKAQYGLFATYVLAISGTLLAALLLVISIADPKGFSALKTAGNEITAPVARFFNSIRQTSSDIFDNTSAYFDAASKNAALQRQVDAERNTLNNAAALQQENEKLRQLLGLIENTDGKPVIARLISTMASSNRNIAIASEGSNAGIESGQPVRGPAGLIGRVLTTGPTTSRILLISDADNVVPVMRASDGIAAFATGLGDGTVRISSTNLGINPFKVGDLIVTSGNGGLYPPNIPLAELTKKTDDGGIGQPLSEPANTPYIIALPIYQPESVAAGEDVANDTVNNPEGSP